MGNLFDAPGAPQGLLPGLSTGTSTKVLSGPLSAQFDAVPAGGWRVVTDAFVCSAAGQSLCEQVDARLAAGAVVYPPEPLRVLSLTPLDDVRVVVLGQDPYHGPGEAEGLAFSVQRGVKIPPSLRNIHLELSADLGLLKPAHGSLLDWARSGVLLLNTSLTVEHDRPAGHAKLGWQVLSDALVAAVAQREQPCVFMLWGAHAQAKAGAIEALGGGRHGLILSNHPSPLAARRPPVPFLGSRPFSRAQVWLAERGLPSVDWTLSP